MWIIIQMKINENSMILTETISDKNFDEFNSINLAKDLLCFITRFWRHSYQIQIQEMFFYNYVDYVIKSSYNTENIQ